MENKYCQLLNETKEHVLKNLDPLPEKGWSLQINKDGYQVHIKENPELGLRMNRTQTVVKQIHLDTLVQLAFDMTRRKEYDENLLEAKVLEQVDESTKIFYGRGKAPVFFVDPRDFVVASKIYKIDNGYMIVTKSVEHPSCPPIKGTVRADMIFTSWIFTQQPDGSVKIIAIGLFNPKGDIPKTLINQGYKFQSEGVKKLLAAVQKVQPK